MTDARPDFILPDSLPTQLPVMALLKGVLCPGTFAPYNVGREASIEALHAAKDDLILVAPQSHSERDVATEDLLPVATLGRIVQRQTRSGGMFVVIQGLARVHVRRYAGPTPHFYGRFEVIDQPWPHTAEAEALAETFIETLNRLAEAIGERTRIDDLLAKLPSPQLLADGVAGALELTEDERRAILLTLDPVERVELVFSHLLKAEQVSRAKAALGERLKGSAQERQREAFLRQQMQAIREELGEQEEDEVAELRAKIDQLEMPDKVRETIQREFRRLGRMPDASPERQSAVDWLERVAALPWNTFTAADIDFDALETALDESHYGLEDVKRQVMEYLSVRKLNGKGRADVLLLVGPPGVGKTSIGQAIAKATGRELVRVALGGVRDEAELRGHRRTYVGARTGRLLEGFRRAGSADPVVLLDEIDKVSSGLLGDPSAALLEILDPEQNHEFVDHYVEVPFDLSRALFIATANDLSGIPAPLRDRMEILEISGYTPAEKLLIARRHLLSKAAEHAGLEPQDVRLDDHTLSALISGWTREAGVRQLQRALGRLYRSAALARARGLLKGPLDVDAEALPTYLKRRRHPDDGHEPVPRPGITTGLAWTPVGGDILYVEASSVPGTGRLVLTGQLGDVMKESARAALTYVLSRADVLNIPTTDQDKRDLHLHVPSGSTPKDGPSAGVTMFTAIASLLSGRTARSDTAMTGEATLRGRVLAVGGIKSKVLAAHRMGIRRVILPRRNEADLDDVPDDVREEMTFILVDHMDDVLDQALEQPAAAAEELAA